MHRERIAIFVLAGLLLGGFVLSANAATIKKSASKIIPAKIVAAKKVKKPVVMMPRKLDGLPVPKGQENLWPIAVMIDNYPAARPQAGLQSASIVYETLAEGGIPRFMAIFAQRKMAEVGPVRSTRPYFVKEAAEINAAMAHAGGSPDGLNLLKNLRMQSIWAIKGAFAKFFYRAHGGGVHGLYTSGTKLTTALKQAKTDRLKALYRPWKFVDQAQTKQRPNGKHGATINLGAGRSYDVEYRYDKKSDSYLRFTGYRPQIDRLTKRQIAVKNVIIMNTAKEKVLDRKGRLDIKVTGRDTGYLLKDGKVIPIIWTKKSNRARTIFTTRNGKEVQLNRGNTWITIVPRGHKYQVY
ncbi:MAG: DUF3048 domain-containing protein [Patescibacteria group bacterium]